MLNKLPFAFILWFTLFYFQFSYSQDHEIVWYTTDHGLPQNSIKDIVKDKYGFIWLATQDGLSRYDGNEFMNFDEIKLNTKRLVGFFGDVEKDSLFIESETFNDKLLINSRRPTTLPSEISTATITQEECYEIFNSNCLLHINYQDNLFFKTNQGYFFIIDDHLLYPRSNDKTLQLIPTHALKDIKLLTKIINGKAFFIDKANRKTWLLTPTGIKSVAADSALFALGSKIFWNSTNKQSFLIHDNSVYEIKFENKRLIKKLLFSITDLSTLNILSLYFDPAYHTLYLGTSTKGLGVVSEKNFHLLKSDNGSKEHIYKLHRPLKVSSLFTANGQVLQAHGYTADYHFENFEKYYLRKNKNNFQNNFYWIRSKSTLNRFKSSTYNRPILVDSIAYNSPFKPTFDIQSLSSVRMRTRLLEPDSEKEKNEWLHLFDNNHWKKATNACSFATTILSAAKISDKLLLVSTRNGLFWFDRISKKKKLIKGSQSLEVQDIKQTSKGSIFLLTNYRGLYLLKDNKLTQMPINGYKALMIPTCILEDKANNLWITTHNGLFKIPENELLAYVQNKEKLVYYHQYNKKNGFNSDDFNGDCGPCGISLATGHFTLPSLDGTVFFNPLNVPAHYPKNGLFVERYRIDGQNTQFFNEIINLPNDFFRAIIYPDVPYFANAKNLYIEAYLEGKSTTWERVNAINGYNLTKLNYGNYQLTFRILISPSADFIYKTITIEVQPLFYQTLSFKLFFALLLIAVLVIIHKIAMGYLVKINKKLELLVNEKTRSLKVSLEEIEEIKNHLNKETSQQKKLLGTISHDIATPLKYITIVATNLTKLSNTEIAKNRDLLVSLQNSSEELYNFTNALKDYANLYDENMVKPFESFNLFCTVEEKTNLFNELASSKSITFFNNTPKNTTIFTNQTILKMVLHNIIDNAVKYTETGSITIEFEPVTNGFNIHIIDTGRGMDANLIDYYENLQTTEDPDKLQLQKFGIGLHMLIQLLPIINGRLYFHKNKIHGTKVTLKILT